MLELKDIKKSYKTNDFEKIALDNVNLTFRKNEFVSILGPSGSGKTTLLNIIGGIDDYTKGDLIINGKSTKKFKDSNWDAYRNCCIGFIFQGYNLINHISVYKNVEMALTLAGVNKKDKKKKVLEALKKVGLLDQVGKKINQLSGGQMQRVAIARALVNDPDIILADEPTGALDSKTSIQIMQLIKEISKNKLVIMVTHNEALANRYSSRIIKLNDGVIIEDNNPTSNLKATKSFKIKKTKMNYLTALSLSLNNIKTKKARTLLTAFASSIGIIGIAIILSISNGFNKKIEKFQKDTLSSFPIAITDTVSIKNEEDKKENIKNTNVNEFTSEQFLYPYSIEEKNEIHENKITKEYAKYINEIDAEILSAVSYYRLTNFNIITTNGSEYKNVNNSVINLSELPADLADKSYLKDNYDLLSGNYPKSNNDVVLIVDSENRIDKTLLDILFIDSSKEKVDFNDIVGKEFKLVSNDDYYTNLGNDIFVKKQADKSLYENINNKTLKITGIVRGKKDNKLANTSFAMEGGVSKIGYSNKLIKEVVNENKESEIVKAQIKSDNVVFMGKMSFDAAGITKENALSMLGASDVPAMMYIYPNSFENKDKVIKYLDDYNKNKNQEDKIIYTDYAEEISTLSSSIIGGITIVLVAFSSIALLVSSVMIGIITYISVLERKKEIGILRSLGARKKDITRVFNAETFIIGAASGLIGIVITMILLFPINNILFKLTDLKNIGLLNPIHALILILISIILTLIGGFVPAKVASKKEPVKALRDE